MPYELTVAVIINSPEDYLAWPAARKVLRWRAVMGWHDYIADLYKKGKVPWSWGSHQLISKFTASPIVSTHVAIYSCQGISEYTALLERDPLREWSSYVTIPLTPLERDWNEEVATPVDAFPLPDDGPARMFQQGMRGLYRLAPSYAPKPGESYIKPANKPAPPDARATKDDPVSYLLAGHGPDVFTAMNDVQRQVYIEKVNWWHGYNRDLVQAGTVSHAWAHGVLCHPGNPASNKKGALAIINAPTYDELNSIINANPIGEESGLLSVVLRPMGDQRDADLARLKLAEGELKKEQSLTGGTP